VAFSPLLGRSFWLFPPPLRLNWLPPSPSPTYVNRSKIRLCSRFRAYLCFILFLPLLPPGSEALRSFVMGCGINFWQTLSEDSWWLKETPALWFRTGTDNPSAIFFPCPILAMPKALWTRSYSLRIYFLMFLSYPLFCFEGPLSRMTTSLSSFIWPIHLCCLASLVFARPPLPRFFRLGRKTPPLSGISHLHHPPLSDSPFSLLASSLSNSNNIYRNDQLTFLAFSLSFGSFFVVRSVSL